jgi:hypothetical protein
MRGWAWWCAVFLTGGLLGLLVHGAHHVGLRLGDPGSCRQCRQRQQAGRAVVVAVSVLMLTGTAMWVHQRAVSPSLPDCTSSVTSGTWRLSQSWSTPENETWRKTRTALTAPITGLAYHYADSRGGGLCSAESVTVAFVPSAASDTALTVGDVFMTGLPEDEAREIAQHESAHVSHWAVLNLTGGPAALPVLYSLDETFFPGSRNHFERAAGLAQGNYERPSGYGPKPQWDKVTAMGMFAVLLFWRRLRCASRTLLHGAAGARYREAGRCRVHSRGWARRAAGARPTPEA